MTDMPVKPWSPGLHPVVEQLLTLAAAADEALDDSEECQGDDGERVHMLTSTGTDGLSAALEALEELPDDQPGCTMGPAAKARWALRNDRYQRPYCFDDCQSYTGGVEGELRDARARLAVPAYVAGIESAARWVDARRDAFDRDHGKPDPATGAFEYGTGPHAQAKLEYSAELHEIAEGLRRLITGAAEPVEFAGHVVGADGALVHIGDLQPDDTPLETGESDAIEVKP